MERNEECEGQNTCLFLILCKSRPYSATKCAQSATRICCSSGSLHSRIIDVKVKPRKEEGAVCPTEQQDRKLSVQCTWVSKWHILQMLSEEKWQRSVWQKTNLLSTRGNQQEC